MSRCEKCGHDPEDHKPNPVRAASDGELNHPIYLRNLKRAAANENLSRRAWRDKAADMIRDHVDDIVNPDGTPFDPPEVDAVFGEDDDQRWLSEFAKEPCKQKVYRLQRRVIERVRLIDLYFRVYYPERAATFGDFRPANDNHPLDSEKDAI